MVTSSEIPDEEFQDFFSQMEEESDLRSFATALQEDEHSQLLLYSAYHEIYLRTNTDTDLDIVIQAAENILSPGLDEVETYAQLAMETSELLRARFERTLLGDDLDRAIHWGEEANRMTPGESAKFVSRMQALSSLLDIKENFSQHAESQEDYSLLEILPKVIIQGPGAYDDEANISFTRAKLADPKISVRERLLLASSLRNIFNRKFTDTGDAQFLGPAIEAAEMARDAASRIHIPLSLKESVQADASYDLGMLLWERRRVRYEQHIEGLNYTIECLDKADKIKDPKRQSTRMNSLSGLLLDRYEMLSDIGDIRRSVSTAKEALRLVPEGDTRIRPGYLYNYGAKLHGLFEATKDTQLLEDALLYERKALEALPPHTRDRRWAMYKTGVASLLLRKFSATGDTKYLDEGIECCDVVSKNTDSQWLSTNYGEYWNVLAGLLRTRYDRLEVKEDIVGAVKAATAAVESLHPRHKYRGMRLCNLSQIYWRRFSRFRDPKDIDEAITNITQALSIPNDDHIHRTTLLSTLSGLLTARYTLTNDISDMEESVLLAEQAWEHTPKDRIDYLVNGNNLARVLFLRALPIGVKISSPQTSSSSSLAYVSRAIDVLKSVITGTPDNPDRATRLFNLGKFLAVRHNMTGLDADLDAAADALDQCSQCTHGQPSCRIAAAARAADLHLSRQRYANADAILRRAVGLLRNVSPRALQQRDQQHMLRRFAGLATLATSVALEATTASGTSADANAAEDALRLLEDGRGIILGLLFEVRSDVATLRGQHPDLAAHFERLRDELDAPAALQDPDSISIEPPMALTFREKLVEEFDDVVDKIRSHEEFKNFLKAPEVAEMRSASSSGGESTGAGSIVVVNVSRYRSDAFIVQADRRVRQLRLLGLQLKKIQEWVVLLKSGKIKESEMFELLEWLWDELASPVLTNLEPRSQEHGGSHTSEPLRIWWIPTGPLGSLPLHAAGLYTGDRRSSSSPTSNLLDRAVSSYSPSIKALLFTRRNMARGREGTGEGEGEGNRGPPTAHRALLIAMSRTPGHKNLRYAKHEIEMVRKSLTAQNDEGENGGVGPAVTILQEPDKAAFLAGLQAGATIAHFAGHGRSDPLDPLQSALLVRDWKDDLLTVRDLIALKLHRRPPFLAYLSACSTGSNKVDDLLDESLHLMSACQLAGFQHVVGSLWAVSDKHCVDVAQAVFAKVSGTSSNGADASVVLSLQEGVKKLRDQGRIRQSQNVRGDDGDDEARSTDSHELSENSDEYQGEGVVYTSRDGFGASSLAAGRSSLSGDPRLWAAYIHIGP